MSTTIQCRLCAEYKDEKDTMSLFTPEAETINLFYKIQYCFSLDFNINLTSFICLICCSKLDKHYNFKELVTRTQELLLATLNSEELKVKIEENDNNSDLGVNDFDNEDDSISVKQESLKDEKLDIKKKIKRGRPRKKFKSTKSEIKTIKNEPNEKKEFSEVQRKATFERMKEIFNNYKWICPTCKKQLPTHGHFRKHCATIHKKKPQYLCSECSNTFVSFRFFRYHMEDHLGIHKWKCNMCGRFYYQEEHLKIHKERMHTADKYKCNHCPKTFRSRPFYNRHLQVHQDIKLQFNCDICNKVLYYKTNSSWITHQKKHQGIRDHICDICGKAFLTAGTLKGHMQAFHSTEEPYKCDHCVKRFKTQSNLHNHRKVHDNDPKHSCETCGKRFHRKSALERHRTTHSNEKPFECEYCHKCFSRKPLLKIHIRQHTGEKPYYCALCNYYCSDSGNYLKHLRTKHGLSTISEYKEATKHLTSVKNETSSIDHLNMNSNFSILQRQHYL